MAELRLDGKTAVITGGGSGIGRATAQRFAAEGARVIIFEIDPASASQTLASAPGKFPVESQILDLTQPAQVEAAFQQLLERCGSLDVLVNVAGGSGRRWGDGPTAECTLDGWHKTLDLNLNSLFYCCKYALPSMLARQTGVIVNIASVLGLVGGDQDFATHAYAASKGAAISLTRSIASFWTGKSAWVADPGIYEVRIGASSKDIRIKSSFTVPRELIVEKVHNVLYPFSLLKTVLKELSAKKNY